MRQQGHQRNTPSSSNANDLAMRAAGRTGPQMPSGGFSHLQQSSISHQAPSHQPSNSTGLPPPSFNHAFAGVHPNNVNPFAPTSNLNGLAGGFGPGGGLNGSGTGLASREAQMGFAHGAALQQQQQQREQLRRTSGGGAKNQMKSRIREVWRSNFAQEMAVIRELIEDFPNVSMDTEFPGIVARPMGAFTTRADYHYQTLRCNVDLLKMIQLGITLFDNNGMGPPQYPPDTSPEMKRSLLPAPCTWQFNFEFSIETDMCNQESINFLTEHGLDLEQHEQNGIDPAEFGAALVTSGMAMFEDVRWISFHSGYDFAYLVKLMLCKELPEDEADYRKLLNLYFPSIYDIKFMMKHAQKTQSANGQALTPNATNLLNNLGAKSGLQDLAEVLNIARMGVAHQAGSDSLLTGKVFWDVKKNIFNDSIDDETYLGQIWGLNGMGSGTTSQFTASTYHHDNQSSITPNLNGATIYNHPPPHGTPSTPASSHTGLASTPNQQTQSNGGAMNSLTPGGGGGAFGGFRGFSKG